MAARAKTPPVVLNGPPRAVRGRVTFANAGKERLVIRGAVLHLPERDPIAVQLTALVAPGATAEAGVSVDLGAGWPAGNARGELEIGGQKREVELHVVPTIALDVSPSEALVSAGSTSITVDVRNVGNVVLPLARVTRGRLLTHDWGDPHISGDPHVSRGSDARENLDATLRLARSVSLQPGESVTLQAQVEIPKGLAADRRHRARLPIGPADLVVTVLPTDPATTTAAKPRKRSTTTKES